MARAQKKFSATRHLQTAASKPWDARHVAWGFENISADQVCVQTTPALFPSAATATDCI